MTSTPNLRRLDAMRSGPMTYRLHGHVHTLPDPVDMAFDEVLTQIGLGIFLLDDAPLHLSFALHARWMAHNDLPDLAPAQRLCFVVDRYADALDYDLRVHARMDLAEMWRTRRWRTLLATIDRLPGHCYYAEAVSQDPEHLGALADAIEAQEDEDSPGTPAAPPLRIWTPEMDRLTDVFDALRSLEHTVVLAQHGKKLAGDRPTPSVRPRSGLDEARRQAVYRKRLAKHKTLAQRLLPHKRDE